MQTTAPLPFQPVFTGLSEQIAIHGRFRARHPALIEGNRRLDWGEYNARANRIAHALVGLGVQPGDRVATVLANGIWAHELLLGIWRAGAVMVPLSPLLSDANLATMADDCDAKLVFASAAFHDRCARALQPRPVFDEASFAPYVEGGPATAPGNAPGPLDLAVIIYSSGTTGTPKGIAHSHESRLKFGAYFAAEFAFSPHARSLSCVPIHSNGAWLSWAPAKWMGATTIILPQFSADDYLRIVEEHAPTHGFAVPTMAHALLAHPRIEDVGLRSFRTLITAGSPMPEAMKRELQRLTDHHLYELWGLTEGVATIITPQDMRTRPHSVGRPMLGCDIRLIDAQDHDVTGTGTGEIVGRSAAMMSGYWNRPDANAAILWHDADGVPFLRTGDIGEFDADGFLTLRGRLKDMIVSGGLNVYPVDIEMQLLRHPDVIDASVAGIEDAKWGESAIGFVRLREGAHVDPATLLEWANGELARHQRMVELHVVEGDFPRNSMGKVVKRDLVALHRRAPGAAP
jgi:long-chain acyl-CoA synthetase